MKFEDWFHQVENYGLKSERFYEDLWCSMIPTQKDRIMIEWLRAAFDAGRGEQNQIGAYDVNGTKPEVVALIDLSTWAADFKTGIIPESLVREKISTIVDAMNVEDRDVVIKSAMYPWTWGYDDE